MLSFFKKFISKLFICIVLNGAKSKVRIYLSKNNSLLYTNEKSFDNKEDFLDYIKKLTKNFQLYYIAIFYENYQKIKIDDNLIKEDINMYLSLRNTHIVTKIEQLKLYEDEFSNFGGLDFAFSPFAILDYSIQKENIYSKTINLYLYIDSHSITMLIYNDKQILYGTFLNQNDEKSCDKILKKIRQFYENTSQNNFVEKLVIFNDINTPQLYLSELENELDLRANIFQVDTLDMMFVLMKEELKNEL